MAAFPLQSHEYEADWQRRVAGMMNRLMEYGATRNLPPAAWTITSGAPQLLVRCEEYPSSGRAASFQAWKNALTELAGQPDNDGQSVRSSSGTIQAWAIWDSYQRVRVNLGAEWDEDPAEPEAGERA
jgi:hypothetical protein